VETTNTDSTNSACVDRSGDQEVSAGAHPRACNAHIFAGGDDVITGARQSAGSARIHADRDDAAARLDSITVAYGRGTADSTDLTLGNPASLRYSNATPHAHCNAAAVNRGNPSAR
jgi:hypothetical protein